MKRILTVGALVVVGVVTLAVSTHAAAGPLPHAEGSCLACALCGWMSALLH